jgi:CDP-6-deoxy-D-xylo-4-hexulose-3-dehydrase
VMRQGVLLPLHHGLTEEMFDRLHRTIEEFLMQYKS